MLFLRHAKKQHNSVVCGLLGGLVLGVFSKVLCSCLKTGRKTSSFHRASPAFVATTTTTTTERTHARTSH
uniref:Putative secreted peptide n=1 Tax=Anopheles braziliensis TaxID=58242 RepID=A0A2M3ZTX8_9DIPT